jgi:hypothetical protein
LGNVSLDGEGAVVDRCGSIALDDVFLFRGNRGEDSRAERTCNLHGDVAHATCTGMDKNRLAGVNFRAVDKTFPGGNGDER